MDQIRSSTHCILDLRIDACTDSAKEYEGFASSLGRDPRFINLRQYEEMYTQVGDLKLAIADLTTASEKRECYEITATELKRISEPRFDSSSSAGVWAIGIITNALTALSSPILSTISQQILGLIGIES